jgi:carbamate kinase
MDDRLIVVALGGNAILRRGDDGAIATQFARAGLALAPVARLAATGTRLVVTHGNGPVVGNIVVRNQLAAGHVTPMPLYVADADSEGGIGFMLQTTLLNLCEGAGCARPVVTLVTLVEVDADDPAFAAPDKPIGLHMTAEQARALAAEQGWTVREEPGCGWRRVVASPEPVRIVEAATIARLARAGDIVIAAGGGGVPVARGADGRLTGIDAVVDKDRASALLAIDADADALVILMEAEAVALGFGTADERLLDRLTAREVRELLAAGAFAGGTIGPKVEAAARFAEATGKPAHICRADALEDALAGRAGTMIGA